MPSKKSSNKRYVKRKDAYHLCAQCPDKFFDRLKSSKNTHIRTMSLEHHARTKHPDVKDWQDLIGRKFMVERKKGVSKRARFVEAVKAARAELLKSTEESDAERDDGVEGSSADLESFSDAMDSASDYDDEENVETSPSDEEQSEYTSESDEEKDGGYQVQKKPATKQSIRVANKAVKKSTRKPIAKKVAIKK